MGTMFQKAVKSKSKLRLAMFGISGSGKTYSSMAIAAGLGGKTAVIDTEHGSASKYADRFEFDVVEMEMPFTIQKHIDCINDAKEAGYNNLIIDSMSHAWQQLLEEVDKLANAKYKGNKFRAWADGTPMQRKFIESILSYPGHIIATMRANTEYAVEEGGKVKRVGTKAEQGKNIEFEFDMLMEMSEEHYCRVLKDRTSKFQDRIIDKPGADLGKELIAWLNEGADAKPKPAPVQTPVQTPAKNNSDSQAGPESGMADAIQKIQLATPISKYMDFLKWNVEQKYNFCKHYKFEKAAISNAINDIKKNGGKFDANLVAA